MHFSDKIYRARYFFINRLVVIYLQSFCSHAFCVWITNEVITKDEGVTAVFTVHQNYL